MRSMTPSVRPLATDVIVALTSAFCGTIFNPMPPIPKTLIGHETQVGQLLADIAHDNVAHAYLFSGPRHVGKCTIARWFAWRLLSDGVPVEEHAALQRQVEQLLHPDVLSLDQLWIADVCEDWSVIAQSTNIAQQHRSKRSPKPRTDTIGIDDIRAVLDRLHQSASLRYRCCIIRSIERLQPEAAHALLKTLEEPPPHVTFLLTTQQESSVLPTIVSRTRRLRFSPLSARTLAPLVRDAGEEGSFILAASRGCPGLLLRLLEDPDLLREHRCLHADAHRFWTTATSVERQRWLLGFTEKGRPLEMLLLHLALSLRETGTPAELVRGTEALSELANGLQTNAHKGLLFQRFALAADPRSC